MTIGQRLRDRRNQLDIPLRTVAGAAGISIPYLSDLERDNGLPPLDTLFRITEALGTTINAILTGVEGFDALGASNAFPLPPGLQELIAHPVLGAGLDEEWIRTLMRIDYKGKRPARMQDWAALYGTLKAIFN